MQTTISAPSAGRKHSLKGKDKDRHLPGNTFSKKNHSPAGSSGYDFLSSAFVPIPATECYPVFNRKNYNYLLESVKNYSYLLGSSFDFKSTGRDFTGLCNYFNELLPKEQSVILIEENGKLSFKVWFGHGFLTHEVYFIPIELLNKTEGMLRDILLTFFQHFQHAHNLTKVRDMYDYEIIVENYEEWYEWEEEPERWEFLKAYMEGYIYDTFDLLYNKPNRSLKGLRKLIKKYKAKSDRENELISSILQGINILEMNKNFFSNVCPPDFLEEDEEIDYSSIVEAERMIRFVYDPYDIVTEGYLSCINTDAGEFGNEYIPRKSLEITPDTRYTLEVDYVECFFTWFSKFIEILYDYDRIRTE